VDDDGQEQQASRDAHDQDDDHAAGPHCGRDAHIQVLKLRNGDLCAVFLGQFLTAKGEQKVQLVRVPLEVPKYDLHIMTAERHIGLRLVF